jgi:hypothetical protein
MEKKKITIEKSVTIKIAVGNFEMVDVAETIRADVEYSSIEELENKDGNLTNLLAKLLKQSAEKILESMGRKRVVKNIPVELWSDTENGPVASKMIKTGATE